MAGQARQSGRLPVALSHRAGDRAGRRPWVPAEELATKLEHIKKWPAEHWKLAFQGQLRTVSERDAKLLVKRMQAEHAHA